MILLVKQCNRERWEDYHDWVEIVYDVETEKSADELDKEWKEDIISKMTEHKITVNFNHIEVIMNHSEVKNKKLHKQILKANGFCQWLEKTYNTKKIEKFGDITPNQL